MTNTPRKFAPVAPVRVSEELHRRGLYGDYHLLLAHWVMEDPDRWGRLFDQVWRDYPNASVIMDNSVVELGASVDFIRVIDAAAAVMAPVVVLPDVIGNMKDTLKFSDAAMTVLNKERPLMQAAGVVQGKSYKELMNCAVNLYALEVDCLFIPRHITHRLGSRKTVVRAIAETYPDIPIHLLGFSDNIRDDMESLYMGKTVRGIDSATPIWLGQQYVKFPDHAPTNGDVGKRPKEYDGSHLVTVAVEHNLRQVRTWLAQPPLQDARDARIMPAE